MDGEDDDDGKSDQINGADRRHVDSQQCPQLNQPFDGRVIELVQTRGKAQLKQMGPNVKKDAYLIFMTSMPTALSR